MAGIVITALKAVMVFGAVLGVFVPAMVYVERKFIARLQQRVGPNRTWPRGLGQPIADIIKLLFKEDFTPAGADRVVFGLAPLLAAIPVFLSLAVVPFGGQPWQGALAPINAGVLFILAMSSLQVYGVVTAGWASNSKYALLGGLRSAAQMVSYELALGLAVAAVVVLSGTLDLGEIVRQQGQRRIGPLPMWNVAPSFLAFLVFVIASTAEMKRTPFDLPEAEPELCAGYHTEYSGIRFALFFMAEYAALVLMCTLNVLLFWGGWIGLGVPPGPWLAERMPSLMAVVCFVSKVCVWLLFYVWVRGTLPRLRYDQLMNLGWKFLLPVGLLALAVSAVQVGLAEGWFS